MTQLAGRHVREVPAKTDPSIPGPPRASIRIDVARLERALRGVVQGEVRFDAASLAMYANDSSNFRQMPIGVVVPKTLDDVVAAHRVCSQLGAPICNRGGGTSLSGETVNYAVVIDNSKYLTGIGEMDVERRLVTCEPGVINEKLNSRTGQHNLVFGPDPSSHSRCVIGGNIGNNSCGIHSVQSQLYGPGPRTSDNVHALEVVTYGGERFWVGNGEEDRIDEIVAMGGRKGEIYARLRDLRDKYAEEIRARYPSVAEVPRRVSGYNLDELLPEKGFNVARALTGTESTCVTVLRAVLMLTPALLQRTLVVVGYPVLADAAEHVMEIIERWRPIGLEGLDEELIEEQEEQSFNVEEIQELPHGDSRAWLLVQFGADTQEESEATAGAFAQWLMKEKGYAKERIHIEESKQEGGHSQDLWAIRESGLGSTAFARGEDNWPGWEDSAVPPSKLGGYVVNLRNLMNSHGLKGAFYGHFGQGCIHCRINFDLRDKHGVAGYRAFLEAAADLVASYGGTLSGEHGDGQQRAELLEKQYGPTIVEAMREFKRIWDPDWKMNPGKVVDPYRLDEDLKLGPDYNPARPKVKFAYRQDKGDFAHATLRCVGVGKCRVPDGSPTMCPSYQVTREEKHSTRGRARLLFEMLRGEVITDGWQSKDVYDALDLCLACKGCTSDCPVQVDMPTYKSEFLYHHYKSARRWRPRYAYAFGFIDQAARLASRVPELANAVTQTPGLARLAKLAAGIDRRRPLPEFAPMTLQEWFRRRGGTSNPNGRPVVVFPDTFNNYFHTDVGVACVEAIEAAGWRVIMPEQHVCCGRPLYDYGFLDSAERYLHRVLDVLREHVRAGHPRSRHGTQLPGRVQGRAGQDAAARRRRPAPRGQLLSLRGVLHHVRYHPAASAGRGHPVGTLPPPGHRRGAAGTAAAGADGTVRAQRRGRLLRPGRIMGLRGREVRDLHGVRGTGAAARRSGSGPGHAHRGQRVLLQDTDRRRGYRPPGAAHRTGAGPRPAAPPRRAARARRRRRGSGQQEPPPARDEAAGGPGGASPVAGAGWRRRRGRSAPA